MDSLDYLKDDFILTEKCSEIITIEPEMFEQALSISQETRNQSRQWEIYFQSLALLLFKDWLQKREPTIEFNQDISQALNSHYINYIDAVCNLNVGEFKVCLIPTSFAEKEVVVPRAVVDLAEFHAHFIVAVAIDEELEVATIKGFIRYDELVNYKIELQPDIDWNYRIPLALFNHLADELLLFLQCLESAVIPLPEIPSHRSKTLAKMQAALLKSLPQLRNRPLWSVLNWEQGTTVLTTPDLLTWLYQTGDEDTAVLTKHLADVLQILTQQSVDVREWLNIQVNDVIQRLSWNVSPAMSLMRGPTDDAAQRLSWQVLPTMSAISLSEQTAILGKNLEAILAQTQQLEAILAEIQRNYGLEIPESAGRAYQNISPENTLRIYAITWPLQDASGWSLLLVLNVIPNRKVSFGFTLRISDQTGVLAEESLQQDSKDNYIFAQVEGNYEDKFLATITSITGEEQTLPPFAFPRELQ